MIKEIFEIEPKQKNVLIIAVGIMGLSFLQLYLFKPEVFEIGIVYCIGIAIGITICWIILNIYSMVLFAGFMNNYFEKSYRLENFSDKKIFILGVITISWISIYTLIGYELNLSVRYFIRLSIAVSLLRTIIWGIIALRTNSSNKK